MKFEQLPMAAQLVVMVMAGHLATQKKKSVDGRNSCMYRSNDGCKCAVGALIPDSIYSVDIEDADIDSILERETGADREISDHLFSLMPGMPANQVREVLSGAQLYHDRGKELLGMPCYATDLIHYGHFAYDDLLLVIRNGIAANIGDEEFALEAA